MTRDPVFFVNAFTEGFYKGNTAAVVILEEYPADPQMLALAREFGFSETAFLKQLGSSEYQIRWFTPEVEVPLCGHATLASAGSLFAVRESGADRITFQSLSGQLSAVEKGAHIELDFPAEKPQPHTADPDVLQALGPEKPEQVLFAPDTRNLVLVYANYETIMTLQPDFARLALLTGLPYFGIAVTAAGLDCDYLCRYFAPWEGINEDPVTGSAQTFLAPYWSERLRASILKGYQASERGGSFEVEVLASRVLIRGAAFIWLQGEISPSWRL